MTTSATPADVAKTITPGSPRYQHDIERARKDGVEEGKRETRMAALGFLQEKFMGLESTATPEGKALLTVARDLSEFFNKLK